MNRIERCDVPPVNRAADHTCCVVLPTTVFFFFPKREDIHSISFFVFFTNVKRMQSSKKYQIVTLKPAIMLIMYIKTDYPIQL